jgi:RimJ/RimL family protein N-acetyltransferase
MMLRFETERLVMTDVAEQDLDGLLDVALSNPQFTNSHEGSDGEPGRFDRDMLERDLAVAWIDPGRHPLVLRRKSDPSQVVGWAEVLDEHPHDHVPWIGLLEVHQQEQRSGYGREAVAAIVEWARANGASALRLGVDVGNTAAQAFWKSLDFRHVDQRQRSGPSGTVLVAVMELRLVTDMEGALDDAPEGARLEEQ